MSGRYRAADTGPDGVLYRAPATFDAKDDAVAWLARRRAEIQLEIWAPEAAAQGAAHRTLPTLQEYGAAEVLTQDLIGRVYGVDAHVQRDGDDLRIHFRAAL